MKFQSHGSPPGLLSLQLLLTCIASHVVFSQVRILDDFETLTGWNAVTSHGDASRLRITGSDGKNGNGMKMDFSFLGHMGSAAAEKRLGFHLPSNYQLSFDIRGDAPVNNFILRLMDSLDNVWVVMRSNYDVPREWTKFTIRKDQIHYGWGPSGKGELRFLDRIMLMIDVVDGGKGTFWIDNLAIEELETGSAIPPSVKASSVQGTHTPRLSDDGRSVVGWSSAPQGDRHWLTLDLHRKTVTGGLVIDWDTLDFARSFTVLLSNDGQLWKTGASAVECRGKRSYIALKDGEGRFLKLEITEVSRHRGIGIRRLTLKGTEFSFSRNDFISSVASEEPRGFFPMYFRQEQSYWTVVGAAGDRKEALVNEQGMIETDKLSFSLEPFLFVDGRLITWNDVTLTQTLEKDYLPIPSVHWLYDKSLELSITTVAAGPAGKSILLTKYSVRNRRDEAVEGRLFVAIRPFQVNPPWQTFTIVGGVSRIDSVRCGPVMRVNDRVVMPLSRPVGYGATAFDQGDVTQYLKEGTVPPGATIYDSAGLGSAAMEWDFDLRKGESRDIVVAVPFYAGDGSVRSDQTDREVNSFFDQALKETAMFWASKVDAVSISLPQDAADIVRTMKTNIAYILINADSAGTQPGSRSYERSWIRDGALTSTALLQLGVYDEVRRFLDWYATYQYPDGMIPAIVETRGPDPTPEHDSHGQFIYAIAQYFYFTHDTTWLRGKWENIAKTVAYIRSIRATRKTDVYRNGTPEQRACFGLVPESISHEGYTPKPMHSYWDDFFIMRGLKDATRIAEILGKEKQAEEFRKERDDFRTDLYASMRLVIKNKNLSYVPGCVELGEFSGLSTTIGITPCDELGNIPEPALSQTFDESYRQFKERKTNAIEWSAYLPYEARFIGAYVYLGQKSRAADILQYLMHDRRPLAWNGWGEVVWKDRAAPRNIGDMPHSWAASDFIRSVRSMLVYEREADNALVLGAGIPESWVTSAQGIEVKHLPTYYGTLTFSMRGTNRRVLVRIGDGITVPEGKIILRSPLARPLREVRGDGRWTRGTDEIIVDTRPATLELSY
jgi:hypothetical protein